jgi:hypothetical protein
MILKQLRSERRTPLTFITFIRLRSTLGTQPHARPMPAHPPRAEDARLARGRNHAKGRGKGRPQSYQGVRGSTVGESFMSERRPLKTREKFGGRGRYGCDDVASRRVRCSS